MKLGTDLCTLLVCCAALAVVVSSFDAPAAPPLCDSTLAFSPDVSSSSEGNGNIHSRSLSPWSWRSSTDRSRIPSTLWEAQCSSSFCSSPNPGRWGGQRLNSVPVYQSILVLNRQQEGCYITEYRSVAVGCTCVLPLLSHK